MVALPKNSFNMATQSKQKLDHNLFIAGGLTTLVITISAILNLNNPNSFYTLLFFLPVPLYFLYQATIRLGQLLTDLFNIDQKEKLFFGEFNFKEFFSQSENSFLITSVLFALCIALILYKISLLIS